MQPQRKPSGAEAEFKSPGKRQRRGAGGSPSTAQQQPSPSPQQQQQSPADVPTSLQEAGGSNEGTLAAAVAAAVATSPAVAAGEAAAATVTDAAKAFRELRVRPGRAASPLRAGGGGEQREQRERGGGLPERPPSPKKRKASYNIDKEFILKDDKVKRNTDTQGDISQARGQLGQLLFEFSQIELNRDLLEAIKRTESKTGRSSGRPPAPGQLDRAAFELAVADATELLQAQLSSLEAHCQEPGLRAAILRSYAVQAIATFADEDGSSDDEDEASPGGSSSDDENADSNSRRQQRAGSSSQDGPSQGAALGRQGALSGSAGSQDGMAPAAACDVRGGRRGRSDWPPSSGAMASPSRHVAISTAEQASSSFLPDAPPESALEDTATAGQREQPAALQQGQQQQREQQGQRPGPLLGRRQMDDGDGMQQRMRMLSLEAEGSVQPQSSAAGGDDEDGPTDMIRSPAPVTSRRMPLPPAMPASSGAAGPAADPLLQGSGSRRLPLPPAPEAGAEGGAGSRRASPAPDGEARMAAVLAEARQLALGVSSFSQQRQRRQTQHAQQAQQEEQQAQQESSEGGSAGQASSAAPEPPKRQRRSGDLLPPVFEHSSQQRRATAPRRASDPGAAAAAAEQRAAILGSVMLQAAGQEQQQQEEQQPQQQPQQQQQQQQQQPGAGAPPAGVQQRAGEAGEGQEAAPDGLASDATLRQGLPRAAHSGSSVWGSTLVCADLTVNDVASQYWPFLRSAMQGQAARLQEGDKALVAHLVKRLGETITDTYKAAAHSGRRPASEVCSLVAATAFDEYFRQTAAESSGASL